MALGDSHVTKIALCFLSLPWLLIILSTKLALFSWGERHPNFAMKLEEGTNTYVHVTPDFGPVCEPGSKA